MYKRLDVMRLPNGEYLKGRNSLDSEDINIFKVNSSNELEFNPSLSFINLPGGKNFHNETFIIDDWIGPNMNQYHLEIEHGLQSKNLIIQIFEDIGSGILKFINDLDDIYILDDNNIKVLVTEVPNGRFKGEIHILKGTI